MTTATPADPLREEHAARHLFCFGCGYSAGYLARRVLAQGGRVSGTATSPARARALSDSGITGHVFDGSAPLDAALFADVTDLLISIPPGSQGGAQGDGVLRHHRALLAGAGALKWVGLLSTTGVYGDTGGEWIDEGHPPAPLTQANRWRLAAEQEWLDFGAGNAVAVQVFRLPGIYGPGRSPFARLRAGNAKRIIKAGQVFNRIHVEDIATALEAGMARPGAGPVFHLADDLPAPADAVLAHAAALLGLPVPPAVPFEEAGLPPVAAHFYRECKRLRNTRMKQELGVTLRYPDYRAGLAATLLAEQAAEA